MISFKSRRELYTLEDLSKQDAADWRYFDSTVTPDTNASTRSVHSTRIERFLRYAAVSISPSIFLFLCLLTGLLTAIITAYLLSIKLVVVYFFIGAGLPVLAIERQIKTRASKFSEDYASMLMATASSVKVGLTPYHALERSVSMLPKSSLVRTEVETLLGKLKDGQNREIAIAEFAHTIRQPDIELFRSAFILVLDNGGRFAPTLSRLASVSYGRTTLIKSAVVSTANMRMTANFLLLAVPVLMLMMSVKTPAFWTILFEDPQANLLASVGVVMILSSYALLRQFSNFKP